MYNLMLGDCLERMKEIPDGSVDMVLCDLPYGKTKNTWDLIIPLEPLWDQYKRIAKRNCAICLFAQTPFDKVLGASNLEMLKYEWIWKKDNATGFLNAKKMPLKIHENILVFYSSMPVYNPQMRTGFKPYSYQKENISSKNYGDSHGTNGIIVNHGLRYPLDIVEFKRDKTKMHPTQKPVALLEYLIKTYTNEGDTVLDNCAGSMSTVIACLNTSRNCIAIEKDENYFNIGCERVKNHILENNMNLCYSQVYGGDVICQDL